MTRIKTISSLPARFPLPAGAGSDAVHSNPEYGYAVTRLETSGPLAGHGISFTLGQTGTTLLDSSSELKRQGVLFSCLRLIF